MKLAFKRQFFDDLDDIFSFIEENFDKNIAQTKITEIWQECQKLVDFPEFGKVYLRDKKFRYLIVARKNLVFYETSRDKITLHRVLDGRRDFVAAINNLTNDKEEKCA
jgi:plasmid stabilization system protein ParE